MKKHLPAARLAISAAIFILVAYAWLDMFVFAGEGALSSRGIAGFKYFTVDSNLFAGFAALADVFFELSVIRKKRTSPPAWFETVYYAAAVSVSLTFVVVISFLVFIFGFLPMFSGPNGIFHFVVPVLAACSLCVTRRERKIRFRETLLALIPLLMYAVYYIGCMFAFGIDPTGVRSDWYHFSIGGAGTVPFVLLLVLLVTWGIALLLRFGCGGAKGKGSAAD